MLFEKVSMVFWQDMMWIAHVNMFKRQNNINVSQDRNNIDHMFHNSG
jgi:hypothetical protein